MCFTSVCEPVSVWACECVCIYFFSLNHLKVNCRYHDTSLQKTCLSSVQFSSVPQSCPTLCNPVNHSTPGLPVHHHLPEFTQTHVHRVGDALQPSHPLSSPSLPAPNPSQHQGLFQWVNSSHEVAKVFWFQLVLLPAYKTMRVSADIILISLGSPKNETIPKYRHSALLNLRK